MSQFRISVLGATSRPNFLCLGRPIAAIGQQQEVVSGYIHHWTVLPYLEPVVVSPVIRDLDPFT